VKSAITEDISTKNERLGLLSPVSSPAGPWIQMVDAVTAMGLGSSFFSGELLFEVEHDSLKIGRFTK